MQAQTGKHRSGIGTSGKRKPWRVSARLLLPRLLQLTRLQPLFSLLALLLWLMPASAAEFGEAIVSSYIGQPLVAEVEVIALSADEHGALLVRPAQLDVYRGASIKFNPALSGLHWVVQRRGERQFIRLSTERPVNATFLNLFLELGVRSEMSVRALTLWLEANPDSVVKAEARQQEVLEREDSASHRAVDGAADTAAPVAESVPTGHAPRLCHGADRCAAVDLENRRISRQITELEKNVDGLRRVLVGAASTPRGVKTDSQPRQASAPAPAEPVTETVAEAASAGTELFLKKEEPIVPKAKAPVVKSVAWKLIAMIVAGALALLLAGLLLYKRSRRNKKTASKNKPPKQLSWWGRMQEKWRKPKGDKQAAADATNASDEDASHGTPEDEPAPNEPTPGDGKKSGRASAMLALLKQAWLGMGARLKQVFSRRKKKPAPDSAPVVEAEG